MNKKRAAREFCFQYFFHLQLPIFRELKDELAKDASDKVIMDSIEEFKVSTNTLLEGDLSNFVVNQIKQTLMNYASLEETIKEYLKNWKLDRLSRVDSTVLLLAVSELKYNNNETSKSVVINEAIEIAKKFGTASSGSFINGVLDKIANAN
ncbi:MAG: transcription antitermination factor NusB [Bacteriovoracaceae bacterium]|nr:transcription antitermination factor NusB [Bacteriovoracaceae bacterium]